MDNDSFDIYKVPAYKRIGNIEARARKLSQPENKRILVPANRVEPFPAREREVQRVSRSEGYTQAVPMPQVIDRRITNKPGTDAETFFGIGRRPYVRDMASKAAEQFVPNSVPRTLVQKVKERMAKDEEYSHSLWGDDEYSDEDGPVANSPSYASSRRMKCVGIITHYFEKIHVCVVDLIDGLQLGEQLIFEEEDHYLSEQMLESMQIERKDVGRANRGQQVGMKIGFVPKLGGKVWKVMI